MNTQELRLLTVFALPIVLLIIGTYAFFRHRFHPERALFLRFALIGGFACASCMFVLFLLHGTVVSRNDALWYLVVIATTALYVLWMWLIFREGVPLDEDVSDLLGTLSDVGMGWIAREIEAELASRQRPSTSSAGSGPHHRSYDRSYHRLSDEDQFRITLEALRTHIVEPYEVWRHSEETLRETLGVGDIRFCDEELGRVVRPFAGSRVRAYERLSRLIEQGLSETSSSRS